MGTPDLVHFIRNFGASPSKNLLDEVLRVQCLKETHREQVRTGSEKSSTGKHSRRTFEAQLAASRTTL